MSPTTNPNLISWALLKMTGRITRQRIPMDDNNYAKQLKKEKRKR